MTGREKLALKLADRCEQFAIRKLEAGFDGFDNMRMGENGLADRIRDAANAFACAAALRARQS